MVPMWHFLANTYGQGSGNQPSLKIGLEYLYKEEFLEKLTRRTLELEFKQSQYGPIEIVKESVSETYSQIRQEFSNKLVFTKEEVSRPPSPIIADYAWLVSTLNGRRVVQMDRPNIKVCVEPARCFLDLKLIAAIGFCCPRRPIPNGTGMLPGLSGPGELQ